jgi:hypothetical protein
MGGWVVIAVSLSAAFAFAVSTSLKHVSAGQVPDAQDLHPRKLGRFIRATLAHPLWLGGIVADLVGLCLQITALHIGALSVVQPLMLSGLLFALVLRQRFEHNITRREIGWAIALTLTLGAFLMLADYGQLPSAHEAPDRAPAFAAGATGLALALACIALGRRTRSGGRAAALLGVATGAIYAADAALLKAITDLAHHGVAAVLTSWQLYTVLVLGASGLLLNQLAFQAGPLTASLPAIATVDPLLSITVGVAVFDEQIRRGPGAGGGLIILLILLGIAVIQLARAEAAPADLRAWSAEGES